MREIPSRRSLFLGGKNYVWSGQTWVVDSNGRAYNTPTLGSELLTNIGFDTDLASWISVPGAGGGTITWSAGAALFTQGSSVNMYLSQSCVVTVGAWLQFSEDVVAMSSANNTRAGIGSSATVRDIAQGNFSGGVRTNTVAGRATTTPVYAVIQDSQSNGNTSARDNATMKQLTLATLFAIQVSGAAGQTVAAKPYAITSGTQAGVIYGLDSITNPQNLILAYHDGVGVTLDKLVSGVWSNVIPRVSVAFSADSEIKIQPLGSDQYDMYYGGIKRGSTATITGIAGTNHGLFSTYNGNTFSEFSLDGKIIPFKF